MKLQYLGTAASEGIPAMFCQCNTCREARRLGGRNIRTRSQALVDDTLLLDYGADTYLHTLRYGLELGNIHSCLITHVHGDHLVPHEMSYRKVTFAYMEDEETPFTVYGSAEIGAKLEVREDGCVAPDKYQGRVVFQELTAFQPVIIEGYEVIPLKAAHGCEQPLIYAILKDGKSLLYAHDTDHFPEETWAYLRERGLCFDFVSLDCTAGVVPIEYHGHMNFQRDEKVRARMLAEGSADEYTRFVVNHFSHNGHINYDNAIDPAINRGFEVAYDGMTVFI